jgi:acyl-CoA dehydrogenase
MSEGIYLPKSREEALGRYEYGLKRVSESAPIYKKLYKATKAKELTKGPVLEKLDEAISKSIITKAEAEQVRQTEEARLDVVLVDEFELEEYKNELPAPPDGWYLPI